MKATILIVEDEEDTRFGLSRYLKKKGYRVVLAGDLAEARAKTTSSPCDAILLDLKLPDGDGLEWIPELRRDLPGIGILVVTGHGTIPSAVEAMRRGADNFLTKPIEMQALEVNLAKALEVRGLRRQDLARRRLATPGEPYFGPGEPGQELLEMASMAAENDAPVLLEGETGTGKGMLARWIHDHSARGGQQFVEVNCSLLRGELLASELFGHVKGAFTSAVRDRAGLVEIADRGTLFLDEVGDMDISLQAQLLKVLEEKQYRRVGETRTRHSEFRVVCATHRDLEREAAGGGFRQDLLYRINVLPIRLPPLREIMEDLPGLVGRLLPVVGAAEAEVSREVMDLFMDYNWPGNIRELRNVLERAVLLAKGQPLSLRRFPGLGRSPGPPPSPRSEEEVTLAHVRQTIERFGGDVDKAAAALGISRRTLYRRLEREKRRQRQTDTGAPPSM